MIPIASSMLFYIAGADAELMMQQIPCDRIGGCHDIDNRMHRSACADTFVVRLRPETAVRCIQSTEMVVHCLMMYLKLKLRTGENCDTAYS